MTMYFVIKVSAISDIRSGVIASCEEAGIRHGRDGAFVFHDLRHIAKTLFRKSDIDKNVRMVIFGHSGSDDIDLRYDTVDEGDLLNAIDKGELFLENNHYFSQYGTKKALKNRGPR